MWQSSEDKVFIWRAMGARDVFGEREGEGGVGRASGRKTRKQGRRKVKNTPDSC